MGCGISVRGPQSPLYLNEFTPPFHELVSVPGTFPSVFPQSGIIENESGKFFDDREHIKQCQIIHINEVSIQYDSFITGIEIQYFLDGGIKVLRHFCCAEGKKMTLTLQNSDSIINCELTHEKRKIKSIRLESIEGRTLEWTSTLGPGSEKASLNLLQQKRAVVAFRGKLSDSVEGLGFYSWKMCGKK